MILVVLYLIDRGSLHSLTRRFLSPEESQEQLEKLGGMQSTKHKALNLTPVFSDVVQPQFILCFMDQTL